MTYVTSDLHGEYGLFTKLLRKIKFSEDDRMIICGDIIDKGRDSVKLAKMIFSMPNVTCILGNHEYTFLKFYRSLLDGGEDTERKLKRLSEYFGGEPVDFDFADEFELLPLYVETESFVCVHSGAPLDENGGLLPLSLASVEELVFDRHFKNPDTVYTGEKCVFFGHTQTDAVFGENIILGHLRQEDRKPLSISDFSKIHLDTGAWSSGIMGCICVESVKAYYVYEDKKERKCTSL